VNGEIFESRHFYCNQKFKQNFAMKRNFVFFAMLLLSLPLLVKAQSVETNSEQAAVRQTVEAYINKTNQNVLHPDAKIFSTDGTGKLTETPINKPYKPVKGETVGKSLQQIAAIDITEGGASVKVETQFLAGASSVYTLRKHIQYISLLKVNGEWKIVSILMPPMRFAEMASK
jgi:hypothetical protein